MCRNYYHNARFEQRFEQEQEHEQEQEQQQSQEEQEDESGNKDGEPLTVLLIADKKSYRPGGYIQGTLSLFVPQSAFGCNEEFTGIHLSLEGKETVQLLDQCNCEYERFDESVVKVDTQVIDLNKSPLVPGQYEYQFYWKLPNELPCSMKCVSSDANSSSIDMRYKCEIHYNLTAYLRRKVASSFHSKYSVVNCVQAIHIQNPPNGDIQAFAQQKQHPTQPQQQSQQQSQSQSQQQQKRQDTIEQKAFKVRSWPIIKKGVIELGFDVLNSCTSNGGVISPNATITVGVTGENKSSIPVQHLLVQWIETTHFGLYKVTHEKVLAECILEVEDLPEWNTQKHHKKQESSSSSQPRRIHPLQLQLNNAKDSYHGKMIQVKHTLQVTAITKRASGKFSSATGGTKNPKLEKEIIIKHPAEEVPCMAQAQIDEDTREREQQHSLVQSCPISPTAANENSDNQMETTTTTEEEKLPQAVAISVDPFLMEEEVLNYERSFSESSSSSSSPSTTFWVADSNICPTTHTSIHPALQVQVMEQVTVMAVMA